MGPSSVSWSLHFRQTDVQRLRQRGRRRGSNVNVDTDEDSVEGLQQDDRHENMTVSSAAAAAAG